MSHISFISANTPSMARSHPQKIVQLIVVFAIRATLLVRASYDLDDGDSSITLGGSGWQQLYPLFVLDVSKIHNGTL
jgi:hypothetical protein